MIHQDHPEGKLVISQPCHAWLSEQIARQWNEEVTNKIEPYDQLCLAAGQHDCGWAQWENNPKINSKTKFPYQFFELDTSEHIKIWRLSIESIAKQNMYASLMVSLHLSHLCNQYEVKKGGSIRTKEKATTFLKRQRQYQVECIKQLLKDEHYAPYIHPTVLNKNSLLLGIWDFISLRLCMGETKPFKHNISSVSKQIEQLTFQPIENNGSHVKIEPYPFKDQPLFLTIESRLINPCISQKALTDQLKTAPLITKLIHLE